MSDQRSGNESGVMKAAASAASKVSNWSPSKQEFASRVTNTGSFATAVHPDNRPNGSVAVRRYLGCFRFGGDSEFKESS